MLLQLYWEYAARRHSILQATAALRLVSVKALIPDVSQPLRCHPRDANPKTAGDLVQRLLRYPLICHLHPKTRSKWALISGAGTTLRFSVGLGFQESPERMSMTPGILNAWHLGTAALQATSPTVHELSERGYQEEGLAQWIIRESPNICKLPVVRISMITAIKP